MNVNRRNQSSAILTVAAQTIKDSVSALDVGQALGWDIDRHGRCPCPFHNGKDRNMKLFEKNRGYSCFVCHASGDVISLVRNYYHDMSFKQVISWFNGTFHLGIDIDSPMNPEAVKQAEIAREKRAAQREFEEWKTRMMFDLYLAAEQIVSELENVRDRNVPKTPYESWNHEFCVTIDLLPEARRFSESTMMDCIKERNESNG